MWSHPMFISLPIAVLSAGAGLAGGAPDLSFFSGFLEDPQADPGENVTVEFTLYNGGSEDAEDFLLGYYLSTDPTWSADDLFIEDEQIGNVESGEAEDESEQIGIPTVTDGEYFVLVVADRTDVIAESDETNNTLSLAITIGTPPPPCPADFNNSGAVDADDLAALLANWMMDGPTDLDNDNITGPVDLAILLNAWGGCA